SVRLHLRLAPRLLRRTRIDRRRADRRLLARAPQAARPRRSLSRRRRVHLRRRMELARRDRHAPRLRAGVDRTRRSSAATAVRLRVVRRLRHRGARALGADEGAAAADRRGGGGGGVRLFGWFRKKKPAPAPPTVIEVADVEMPAPPPISAIIPEPKSEKKRMPRIVKCGLIQTSLACDVKESLDTIRDA